MSNITSFRQKFHVPELEILKGKCDRNNTLPKTLLKEYPPKNGAQGIVIVIFVLLYVS
jgi:hypothetical protein